MTYDEQDPNKTFEWAINQGLTYEWAVKLYPHQQFSDAELQQAWQAAKAKFPSAVPKLNADGTPESTLMQQWLKIASYTAKQRRTALYAGGLMLFVPILPVAVGLLVKSVVVWTAIAVLAMLVEVYLIVKYAFVNKFFSMNPVSYYIGRDAVQMGIGSLVVVAFIIIFIGWYVYSGTATSLVTP